MYLRERYYDGHGNELRFDETVTGSIKVTVNTESIDVPLMKFVEMLSSGGQTKGKHAKVFEIR